MERLAHICYGLLIRNLYYPFTDNFIIRLVFNILFKYSHFVAEGYNRRFLDVNKNLECFPNYLLFLTLDL